LQNDLHVFAAVLGAQFLEPRGAVFERSNGFDHGLYVDHAARDQIEAQGIFAGTGARARHGDFFRDHSLKGKVLRFRREVADEHAGTASFEDGNREVDGRGKAHDFERGISTESLGESGHLGGDVARRRIERVRRAEPAGEREAILGEVHGDDAFRSRPAQSLDNEQSDHAAADDHDGIRGGDFDPLHGVHGDGDRLDHRGLVEREGVGQSVENSRGHGDKFSEGAVLFILIGRDAHDAAIFAEVNLALAAEVADAAINRGVERHAIAGVPLFHAGTGGDDFTRGLMAHNQRRLASTGRAIPPVKIATADTAGVDTHQDFVVGDGWRGEIDDGERARSSEKEGFHELFAEGTRGVVTQIVLKDPAAKSRAQPLSEERIRIMIGGPAGFDDGVNRSGTFGKLLATPRGSCGH